MTRSEAEQINKNRAQKSSNLDGKVWHSWDSHPWKHPWLTVENIKNMKQFSASFMEHEMLALKKVDISKLEIGFVGNIANCMYLRAKPMRSAGLSVNIFLHPQDNFVMSHPSWEEFDGTIPADIAFMDQVKDLGMDLPKVNFVHSYGHDAEWHNKLYPQQKPTSKFPSFSRSRSYSFIRQSDVDDYPSYMTYMPTLEALQKQDVLWGTQVPYLAYLANKPYVVSQMGGDIWFEASRGDELGRLQRKAFSSSRAFLVSNPWSYAHARRFGLNNLIYLPLILDQEVYDIGHGKSREQWVQESGGDFFVLTSSRLDSRNKGSEIGIRGFAEFSKKHSGARLVLIGWGNDLETNLGLLKDLEIVNKVIILPISGKARIRDYLRSADVFMDQFILGYYGSAGMEAMACGLPVIGRIETDQYEAMCETGAPPIHNCSTQYEVEAELTKLADNKGGLLKSSQNHRDWFVLNHGSAHWLEAYKAVLAATFLSQQLSGFLTQQTDFSRSPLSRPLSQDEIQYHADGLDNAPEFPNYGW
ncbi:glycosyltransferase [Alphaproteobacteria bacterium]|nr:glycosyltransferase [Alphaproteobacteria bacterium]